MMRELRQGVRLKKVEHIHLPPVEFELTPFEILLEDIRTRRYTLNKVQVRKLTSLYEVIIVFDLNVLFDLSDIFSILMVNFEADLW